MSAHLGTGIHLGRVGQNPGSLRTLIQSQRWHRDLGSSSSRVVASLLFSSRYVNWLKGSGAGPRGSRPLWQREALTGTQGSWGTLPLLTSRGVRRSLCHGVPGVGGAGRWFGVAGTGVHPSGSPPSAQTDDPGEGHQFSRPFWGALHGSVSVLSPQTPPDSFVGSFTRSLLHSFIRKHAGTRTCAWARVRITCASCVSSCTCAYRACTKGPFSRTFSL